MANAVETSALEVGVASAVVRVPALAGCATKMDIGIAPCTEGAPMHQQDLSRRPVDQN